MKRGQRISESSFLGSFSQLLLLFSEPFLPQPSTFQDCLPWLSDGISALMSQVEMNTLIAVWFVHEICCCCEL